MKRDFLAVSDLSAAELIALFEAAQSLASAFRARRLPGALRGKAVALWFNDRGFRNRVAFQLGIQLLGGQAIVVPGELGTHEAIEDVAAYLSNWFDAIVVRASSYEALQQLASSSSVPVINARTPHNHPCEIMGDLTFVYGVRGSIEGLTVVFVGEASNLCRSWFEAAVALPIRVIQVCPEGYAIDDHTLIDFQQRAVGDLQVTHDLDAALQQAQIVYTDCWPARSTPDDEARTAELFAPYQITVAKLAQTPADAIFLPCPPVTRGEEVSAEALTSPRCRVHAAKDYLLHAQNALLLKLLAGQ